MTARDELEAALAACWDRDTLAVYADHLLSSGDPRGELIALDLQIEAGGSTPALAERRTSLLYAWLGGLVPVDNPHHSWVGDTMRFGFVEDLVVDTQDPNSHGRLAAILHSPAGPYLQGVTIRGATEHIERTFEILAEHRHAWLARLVIVKRTAGSPIAAEHVAAMIEAAPRLELLDVKGRDVFARFPHPTLRRLRVTDWEAIRSLFGDAWLEGRELEDDDTARIRDELAEGPGLAATSELDLAYHDPASMYWDNEMAEYADDPWGEIPAASIGRLPPKLALPALQRLDLSRNEHWHVAPSGMSPFAQLTHLPQKAQLTHVRLPALRSQEDFDVLAAAVTAMPALVEVEIVTAHYYDPPELPHPHARFVHPPPWPWPRADDLQGGESLHVALASYDEDVQIADAAHAMEQRYEGLPADARAAWTELWQLVAQLQGRGELPLSANVLGRALEACDTLLEGGWRELRDELRARRPFAADVMVAVRRG